MTTVFRLDASIRAEGSVSRAVGETLENTIVGKLGDDVTVIHREIGLTPLPSEAWATAAFAGFVPEADRSPEQNAAVALAAELAAEVAGADAVILDVPLYNWGVSQHIKTWIDLLLTTEDFTSANNPPKFAGKPAFLVIARGGGYAPGLPKHGWDHATAYLQRILVDVWGFDVELIEAELTLARVSPAMSGLIELADKQLADAHAKAASHGEAIAAKLGESAAA